MNSKLCSEAPDIQLFDPETMKNPYPAYKKLRDEAPIFYEPGMNVHVVTRYELLREIMKDTETYSSKFDDFMENVQQAAFQGLSEKSQDRLMEIHQQMIPIPPTMLTLDRPEHTQYRSLVAKLFTAGQVAQSQANVQSVIDEKIAGFEGAISIDFMERFAFPVPLRIIGDRLGIPPEERAFFNEAATAAAATLKLSHVEPDELIRRTELGLELQRLLVSLIEERRIEPREDMITILANSKLEEETRHLTDGEIIGILNQFLVAGHETTTSSFGWGMLLLCQNPGVQDEIRGDPKLIKTFVEEALRLEAPVQGLPRRVTRETQLGGYDLKEGDLVMARFGAANRDERQFENPDGLNVHRQKPGLQMAFGSGVHHCIGAPLARQELNLGWFSLLESMRNIRLDDSFPSPEAEPSFILRNLPVLNVQFDKIRAS
ncbi:MAG: hypothetical protein CMQ19_06160 [Gammaproteobacteria bacterium]|nr:hypothetical protein [Gammaproteobacteria bacterium]